MSFSTPLDSSKTQFVTVDGTAVDVNYDPSINGDQVSAGDSFQIFLSGPGADDIEIASYDANIVWSGSSDSSQILYSDTYSETVAAGGGGGSGGGGGGGSVPDPSIRTSLSSSTTTWDINIDVTGGDSFSGTDNEISVLVTLKNTSDDTMDSETFRNDVYTDTRILYSGSFGDDRLFHEVGDGYLEYSSSAGGDQDFSSGDSMTITIGAGSDVVVVEYQIAIFSDDGDVLYETTVTI